MECFLDEFAFFPNSDLTSTEERLNRAREMLIQHPHLVFEYTKNGKASLNLAIERGDVAMARLFIEYGADVNQTARGYTPLTHAAEAGQTEIASLLVDYGVNANGQDARGRTPLGTAARYGRAEVGSLLIDRGANVNGKDASGETPLCWALRGWDIVYHDAMLSLVPLLLERGGDPNLAGAEGMTALMWAARQSFYVLEGTQMTSEKKASIDVAHATFLRLLEVTADVNQRDQQSSTALHHVRDVVYLAPLIGRGADLNARIRLGWTPLHAYVEGKPELVQPFLRYGPNLNLRDRSGQTPLHRAAHSDYKMECAQVLIEAGADLEIRDRRGYTPLHWAVTTESWNIFNMLLAAGADANARDKKGRTPLRLLEDGDFVYAEERYRDYYDEFPPLRIEPPAPGEPFGFIISSGPGYSDFKGALENAGGHL